MRSVTWTWQNATAYSCCGTWRRVAQNWENSAFLCRSACVYLWTL